MILNLVDKTDLILHRAAEPFDFSDPEIDPDEMVKNLTDTMIHFRGIGLAAPQVGLPYRCFVVGNPDENESIIPVFNPRIVDMSMDQIGYEEGCLSFPNLYLKIKRPENIRARFERPDGTTWTFKFEGVTARIFQHELDHLDGITFTKKVSKLKLDMARRKMKKYAHR
tara:strand:+ start:14772 stop:15275 length:504 start_codon:yes stop_codon:yes gene_type:complete